MSAVLSYTVFADGYIASILGMILSGISAATVSVENKPTSN